MAVGMGFTLAFLPIGLIVAILIGIAPGCTLRQKGMTIVVVGLGFLIPTLLGWLITQSNPFVTWWWNQRNHARFYAEYPRSYLAWSLANPIELAVALGLAGSVWSLVGIDSDQGGTSGCSGDPGIARGSDPQRAEPE